MDNFHDCCTKHGIYPIFCWMPNRIKTPISSPGHIFQLLYPADNVCLVRFPVVENDREKVGFLVPKAWPGRIHLEPHVAKHQQHLAYGSSRQQHIANREFATERRWFGFPDILIQTLRTTLDNSNHGPILPHGCRWPTCLALEAEQGEQLEQHAVKQDKFGLICWGFWINSIKIEMQTDL